MKDCKLFWLSSLVLLVMPSQSAFSDQIVDPVVLQPGMTRPQSRVIELYAAELETKDPSLTLELDKAGNYKLLKHPLSPIAPLFKTLNLKEAAKQWGGPAKHGDHYSFKLVTRYGSNNDEFLLDAKFSGTGIVSYRVRGTNVNGQWKQVESGAGEPKSPPAP